MLSDFLEMSRLIFLQKMIVEDQQTLLLFMLRMDLARQVSSIQWNSV